MTERKYGVCSDCAERILRLKIGSQVSVQSGSQVFIGKLIGFHIIGKSLSVCLQQEADFRVVENIVCVNFLNQELQKVKE